MMMRIGYGLISVYLFIHTYFLYKRKLDLKILFHPAGDCRSLYLSSCAGEFD